MKRFRLFGWKQSGKAVKSVVSSISPERMKIAKEIARICKNEDLKSVYWREVLEHSNKDLALKTAKNYAKLKGIKW